VANYGSGTVAVFPARPDGSLAEASSVDQHEGSGPDAVRQAGPHAHCIVPTADDRYAFSADLGSDEVIGYRVDHEARALVRHSRLRMPSGSGPRQLVFAPGGRHAWVVGELDATMSTLAFDAASGILSYVESVPLLPRGAGPRSGADVEVHPSGRFVYGSNRGHDSIAMFAVDEPSGRLRLIGHRSSEGRTPRDMVISEDGRFLLVANQDSDTIVVMPIDQDTGDLGSTAWTIRVPTPACLRFGRPARVADRGA
jgi:6-phosphogluconolactonase